MHFAALANAFQQHYSQLAAEMLPEFIEAAKQLWGFQLGHMQRETKRGQQAKNAVPLRLREHPGQMGIRAVESNADCDGFTMIHSKTAELLQLMSRPMAEIQRAGGAHLERIAG